MAVELLSEPGASSAPPTDNPSRRGIVNFVGRRLVHLIGLLVGVALLGFVLMELSPVDPIDAYVGGDAVRLGEEQRALIAERWGLDDPTPERLARWAGNLITGDMGTSTVFNAPVTHVIGERFVASLALLATAWLLSGVLGFVLGLVAAATRGSLLDRSIRWFAYTLASAPTFWVGLLLLTLVAVQLGWAPTSGATPVGLDPAAATLGQRLHHLFLPALTLSVVGIAPITLHTRARAVEVLGSDVVLFARAQGDSGWSLIRHRVVRNAAVPALMLQFASISELLGGSVLAEQVFNYPGLGQATVRAGIQGDVPLLLGIALFATVLVYVGNQMGDIAQRLVDPRVPVFDGGARQ
ncbi:MAG TPA: ABC transporter permease [Acidimicrobiia bacterium]|nr:ABC transporter permease [Acidimicrobiia bacterium]